jgi:tripartite motif-containing protein 2/3/tripartite motif-containing protein 71
VPAASMNCPKHDDSLSLYCETCQELICRECTIRIHRDHTYDTVEASYHKYRHIVSSALADVDKKKDDVKIKVEALKEKSEEIREQGKLVKDEIHLMAEEMIKAIRESEKRLMNEVNFATDGKLLVVSSQIKSAELSLDSLNGCSDYVKQGLEMDDHQVFLLSKQEIIDEMSHVSGVVKAEDYNSIEKSDIQFFKTNIKQILIGDVAYTNALHQCKVKSIDSHQVIQTNESFSFPLTINHGSSLLILPLSSLSCSVTCISAKLIKTTVTSTDNQGVFKIHCTPVIRGMHLVRVRVNGIQLENASINVLYDPRFDASMTPIHIVDGFVGPFGVAISNDRNIIVSENGSHRITVLDTKALDKFHFDEVQYDKNGHLKSSWNYVSEFSEASTKKCPNCQINISHESRCMRVTCDQCNFEFCWLCLYQWEYSCQIAHWFIENTNKTVEFSYPRGIAITPDNCILVTDNNKICKINMEGNLLATFGQRGNKVFDFDTPNGIAISPTGQIYVADMYNHRIQVLNSDLTFSFSFGSSEQLHYPVSVAIDEQGVVYVNEWSNNRIHKFTAGGDFISQFGVTGSRQGQLFLPRGMAINNNFLYVVEKGNNRVSVFSTDGELIRCFGSCGSNKDQFDSPRGITFDSEGRLYICDSGNNRIVVYC